MKTMTRREMLCGLVLGLAVIPTSNALADSGADPLALNEKTPLEGPSDSGGFLTPEEFTELQKQDRIRQYNYYIENLAPYVRTVPFGETYPLANVPEAFQPCVYWNGTMEVTVLAASLHASIEDALTVYDLGEADVSPQPSSQPNSFGRSTNWELLVTQIQVTNIDAQNFEGAYYFTIETFAPKSIELNIEGTGFREITPRLASFDGATQDMIPGHSNENRFELLPGETKTITASYWISYSYNDADGTVVQTHSPANTILRPELATNPTAYGLIHFELGLSDPQKGDEDSEEEHTHEGAS